MAGEILDAYNASQDIKLTIAAETNLVEMVPYI